MNNWKDIKNKYDELTKLNNGIGEKSFSLQVLSNIRNQTFHYAYEGKELRNNANVIEKIEDSKYDTVSMRLLNVNKDTYYAFADEIYLHYARNLWEEYAKNNNENSDVPFFLIKLKDISITVAQIFDLLIDGYFERYTNLYSNDFDGILKKTL